MEAKSLKILVINNLYPPQDLGGYGRSIADFAQHLAQRGHCAHVLTSRADYLGPVLRDESNINRNLLLFGSYNKGNTELVDPALIPIILERNLTMLESIVAEIQPDVCLIGNVAFLGMTILRPLLARKIPVIHHYGVTGPLFHVSEFPQHSLYHLAVASDYVRTSLLKHGFPVSGSLTVYPGACVSQFLYHGPYPSDGILHIACASLLTPSKGIHVLLEALAQLFHMGVKFICNIAGTAYHEEYVAAMGRYLKQEGLEQRVNFVGRLDRQELIQFYRDHHVLVFPSLEDEAFGISQVEAMAAGITVVTSGVGGAAEVVDDGVSGIVSPPGDSAALAQNLFNLASNPGWRKKMAEAGQQRAVERFDVERAVDHLESLFNELLCIKSSSWGESTIMGTTECKLELAARLIDTGDYQQADQLCKELLQELPENADIQVLLGNLYFRQQKWSRAAEHFLNATAVIKDNPYLFNNCGLACAQAGKLVEAEIAFLKAIALDPDYAAAWFNLGYKVYKGVDTEKATGALKKTITLYRRMIDTGTASVRVYRNLADSCAELHQWRDALEAYKKAVDGSPEERQDVLRNIATCHVSLLEYGSALAILEQLRLSGEDKHAEFWSRLGTILGFVGRVDSGVSAFQKAEQLAQTEDERRNFSACSMFMRHYLPQYSPESIAADHREWGQRYCPLPPAISFRNNLNHDRILRVGYVSPDFRNHAVVFFIQPVLAAHDTGRFNLYCYSNVEKPDNITRQLRDTHPVIWRDISTLSDDEAFRLIQDDQIDILVDLAGHSVGNRLTLFGRQPAPVQMTWIGYPDTTGVPAIQYRITDAKADPPGMTEHLNTEQLIRLPRTFLCYRPGGDFPPESPLPRLANGFITFGSFSNFTKVTPETLALWSRILAAVPESRFITKVRGLSDEMVDQQILEIFRQHGIAPDRITVLTYSPSVINHLEEYHRLDIALDTFPYCGTTTTCESLLMGVPVISLAGKSHVSRVGASLLETVGIQELAVDTEDAYIQAAINLAADLPRLLHLRKNLRWMVQQSPLCDNVSFSADLEATYRKAWKDWCRARTGDAA